MVMPHCREQYGQWVAVVRVRGPTPARAPGRAVAVTAPRVVSAGFPTAASASSLRSGALTAVAGRLCGDTFRPLPDVI
jgi:hypothetical protein